MGRKAKLKKLRQQQAREKSPQSAPKYRDTEFAKQFEHMGYQVKVDPKLQPKTNRGNVAPEIPQERIEPQL
ncbi:MAG: hypothetical protein AAFQ41_16695 [Cyanobacteria bacterium J06623_7]